MKLATSIDVLERSALSITTFFAGVTDERARWRPEPGKWSMLEVLVHLVEEERLDFRARLKLVLAGTDPWPSIDPAGWVTERDYNGREVVASVDAFQRERDASIAWLHALDNPDWESAYEHPALGTLRAGDLLASWVVHDFAHLRQLADLETRWISHTVKPFSTAYALG